MKGDQIIAWVLIISTFLIGGKAIGLLDISWTIAFGPVAIFLIASVVVFLVSGFLLYLTISKNIEKDGKRKK